MTTEFHEGEDLKAITNNLIEVNEMEVDRQRLMDRVRKRIERRRKDMGYDPVRFPSFGGVAYPGKPNGDQYDPDLYHHLMLANKTYTQVETNPLLDVSPATRIPVLGRLWSQFRIHAHNLVLFYVNRAIRHEVDVNRHLISVLNSLAIANQEQQDAIVKLEAEIEELRSKLKD